VVQINVVEEKGCNRFNSVAAFGRNEASLEGYSINNQMPSNYTNLYEKQLIIYCTPII